MNQRGMDIIPPRSRQLQSLPEKQRPEPQSFKAKKPQEEIPEEKIKKEKKNKKPIIFVSFLVLGGLFLGSYFYLKKEIQKPLDLAETEEKIVEFQRGEKALEIGKKLESKGIIKNQFYFVLYVFKKGDIFNLQAGRYSLSPSMTISEIVDKIVSGKTAKEEVKITIPEGFRISQIEARINQEFKNKENQIILSNFTVKDFQEEFSFLEDASGEESLEGYLFPDTYFFKDRKDMTDQEKAEAITRRMLQNFGEKLNQSLREEIKNNNKSIFEIVTMASILEKEVKTKHDREIVSGIFWRRIENGQPLESCATIAYILGKNKWRYSYEDTRIESPYNTYLNQGLPKGPISNPGLEALRAAINFQETDYNFFLTDPETGATIFATTLQEHNQNKVKYFNQ